MSTTAKEKKISASFITALRENFSPEIFKFHVPLCKFSRWNVGGYADLILMPKNIDQLCRLRYLLNQMDLSTLR